MGFRIGCVDGRIEFPGRTPPVPEDEQRLVPVHCTESSRNLQKTRREVRVLSLDPPEFVLDDQIRIPGGYRIVLAPRRKSAFREIVTFPPLPLPWKGRHMVRKNFTFQNLEKK